MLILFVFVGAKIIKGKRPNKKNKEAWYETILLRYEFGISLKLPYFISYFYQGK
jgi:hypothetical protein